MTAYVNFVIEQRSNALLVPNAALRFSPRERRGQRRSPWRTRQAASVVARRRQPDGVR